MYRRTAAFVFACLIAASASADVAFSNPYPTATGVGGVNVAVYHRGVDGSLATIPGYADLYAAVAYTRAHSPAYTFTDTGAAGGSIAWGTVPESTATSAFFNGQAAGAAATDSAPIDSTIFDVYGLVYLPAAGTYSFALSNADDGAALYFGGTGSRTSTGNLIDARTYNVAIDAAPGQSNPAQVTVTAVNGHSPAGWYPFECVYYNQYNPLNLGAAGLTLSVTGQPGIQFATTAPSAAVLTTPVPSHRYNFETLAQDVTPLAGGVPLVVTAGGVGPERRAGHDGHVPHGRGDDPGRRHVAAVGQFHPRAVVHRDRLGQQQSGAVQPGVGFESLPDRPPRSQRQRPAVSRPEHRLGADVGLGRPPPAQGVETMIAVTYDATLNEARLYVNGNWVGDITLADTLDLAATAAGAYSGLNGFAPFPSYRGLNGLTDEFRLYGTTLTQAQVGQDFTTGNATLTPASLAASPTALVAAVPEPATGSTLLVCVLLAGRRGRRDTAERPDDGGR